VVETLQSPKMLHRTRLIGAVGSGVACMQHRMDARKRYG